VGDWCSGGVECRSGDDAGGERREEVRGARDGRCGVLIDSVVERGWKDSCVVDVAVVGRVDGDVVAAVWRGEEALE
jgi:hypothetical protein